LYIGGVVSKEEKETPEESEFKVFFMKHFRNSCGCREICLANFSIQFKRRSSISEKLHEAQSNQRMNE